MHSTQKGVSLRSKQGFTLIELLVVIAILIIFSGVIITNQSSSKNRASDGVVMGQMTSARLRAEVYREENDGNFSNVCSDAQFVSLMNAASQAYNKTDTADVCNQSQTAWAAYVPLKTLTSPNTGWCIDSRETAKASTALGSATVCP